MKNKDIRKLLKKEKEGFINPNLKQKTLTQFPNINDSTIKKPKLKLHLTLISSLASILLITLFLTMFMFKPTKIHAEEAYVVIDTNPAVVLRVDKDLYVLEVEALNQDGLLIINDGIYKEKPLKEALNQLLISIKDYHFGITSKPTINLHTDHEKMKISVQTYLNDHFKDHFIISSEVVSARKLMEDVLKTHQDLTRSELKNQNTLSLLKHKYEYQERLMETLRNHLNEKQTEINHQITMFKQKIEQDEIEVKELFNELINVEDEEGFRKIYKAILAHFPNEPVYEELKDIKLQLDVLSENIHAYLSYKLEIVESNYHNAYKGYKAYIKEHAYSDEAIKNYDFSESLEDVLINVSDYVEMTIVDKVVIKLINDMTKIIQRDSYMGMFGKTALDTLYIEYRYYIDNDKVSMSLKTSNLVVEFESLYQNYKNK